MSMRSDVHPCATVESEHPITECETCGLPVPAEANGDIYCNAVCANKALDEALRVNAIAEAHERGDFFAEVLPKIVALPEPCDPFVKCSCH